MVVHPSGGEFEKVEVAGNEITAGVGAKLKQVAYAGKAAGIGGLEWMEGIPGAVGGGLRMNAGAMGAQTFEKVVRVRYLDGEGNAHDENAGRTGSALSARSFAGAKLCGLGGVSRERRRPRKRSTGDSTSRRRNAAQPNRARRAPAAFSKIRRACPAGKLVDELGLKNSRVGNARVSEVHGNFIVNDGGATAAEVLELIEKIKDVARDGTRDRIGNRSANRGGGSVIDV